MALVNIARIRARPDRAADLAQALAEIAAATPQEPGCAAYALHRSRDEPDVWMVYEAWKSDAALNEHMAQPYVVRFLERIEELVSGPIELASYDRVEA